MADMPKAPSEPLPKFQKEVRPNSESNHEVPKEQKDTSEDVPKVAHAAFCAVVQVLVNKTREGVTESRKGLEQKIENALRLMPDHVLADVGQMIVDKYKEQMADS